MSADTSMSDDEYDYDYEYDYEDGDDDDDYVDNESQAIMMDDRDDTFPERNEFFRDAANPNAPPSVPPSQLYSSSNPGSTTTWIAQKPAAVSMMPAEALIPEMDRRLTDATEALGIPRAAAAPLLRGHQWSVQTLLQSYYADPDRVLKEAGVLHRCHNNKNIDTEENINDALAVTTLTNSLSAEPTSTECLICYEAFDDTVDDGDDDNEFQPWIWNTREPRTATKK